MSYIINSMAVLCGGGAGAVSRFLMNGAITAAVPSIFPYGILIINVLGGFIMGLLQGCIARSGHPHTAVYSLLGTGFLGGFTTFSHFSLNCLDLSASGHLGLAAVNVIVNTVFCVVAAGVGYTLTGSRVAHA